MSPKFLSSLLLAGLSCLNAAQVDIYALNVEKKGEILEATQDVIIFSDFYFITANKAIYNEKLNEVELFGDVNILRGANERSHSNYAKIKLDSNEANFENFFFSNNKLEVWFQSKQSSLNDAKFHSTISSVSSCNVDDPDWEIRFSDGYLNRQSNFVHLYNAKLYVKNVPVFYLPYFGFSADTSRQSGLLVPKFTIKSKEGLYYEQPIYIAPYDNWDLELSPQIRTSRGYGLYSTLRFINSAHSLGELNFGAFREQGSYFKDQNLKYQTHKGIEFKYYQDELVKALLSDSFQEGLYVDGIYLNDVDYLTLGSRDYRDLTSLVTSKLNYFLADEKNFYAAYAKYYIDTSKLSNATTLQEYPSFQYHRFLDTFLSEYLGKSFLYSFDASFNNFYRKEGSYARFLSLNLPITYHQSLFDDLVNFKLKENLYANFANYTGDNLRNKEHYFRNVHEFELYTDLAKAYDSFYHTITFGTKYLLPGARSGQITADYLDIEKQHEQSSFYTTQFFYNEMGEKKLKHHFDINYLSKRGYFDETTNLLTYYFNSNLRFNNEVIYSNAKDRFSNVLNQAEIDLNSKFRLDFSHAYQNDEYGKYNFIGTRASVNINKNYNTYGGVWFDTTRSKANMWELGYTFARKCWNYSLVYRQRIDPQLSSAGITARNQSGVYFLFNFYPIGGVKYDLTTESENKI